MLPASASLGFMTILIAGLLQGTVLTPMKYLRHWRWENIWLVYASFAYLLLPWVFALATVPDLTSALLSAPTESLVRTLVFGFFWGVAVVLFGLGCRLLGLALGYAIILGLGTSVGSLVPLITQHPDQLFAPAGLGTMAGVVLLTVAVTLFSVAGKWRDQVFRKTSPIETSNDSSQSSFLVGLIVCILCGILNPLYNIAFAYGAEIQKSAIQFGAAPANAGNAVWLIVANAGYLPSLLYSLYLISRNRSFQLFREGSARFWVLTPMMGLIWILGTVLYGVGANLMGSLGPVIGWPFLMSTMVLTANIWGFITGEWKGVRGLPIRLNVLALVILVTAMFTLGWSSRF